MQLINLLISFVVYYPFFRMWDLQKLREESELEAGTAVSDGQQASV